MEIADGRGANTKEGIDDGLFQDGRRGGARERWWIFKRRINNVMAPGGGTMGMRGQAVHR